MQGGQEGIAEGRRERKKRELRARIYRTARQLFLDQGFEATTVEQIAEAADVAPATFFNHFQSKNGLLSEMRGEVFGRLQALIEGLLLRPASTQERISGFVEHAASEIEQSRDLAHDVLIELIRTSVRPGEAVPYLSRLHAPFAAILREGQETGHVRRDLDAAFLAEMVVGVLNAAMINWLNDPVYPVEKRLRQSAAFIGEAIKPRGGSPPSSERQHDGPRAGDSEMH
jgi:AcrR family transcriptional regulator